MNPLKNLFHSRDKPKNSLNLNYSFFFDSTTSGKTVNERTAMQTTAVYSCVGILADVVAIIMALDRAFRNGGNVGSVYDERGILVL